jgi:TPR repeat protein
MYQTIMRHFTSDDNKDLICQSFQALIASLERKTPCPSTLEDDARHHTVYDKMHGRKRGDRGGLEQSSSQLPAAQRAKASAQTPPATQLPVVFKPTSPLRVSSMPVVNWSTTISQGCNHFRTGMQNLNEIGNYVVASQELQAAVNLGHLEAHAQLAMMYMSWWCHMPQNRTAAFKLAETGSNFKNNCPHCLGVLSICYYHGWGVRKNGATALKHAQSSCAKNSYVGQYAIATIYGADDVVSQNLTKSFEYFTKSATQNFRNAQYDLGFCYEEGCGVQKNAQQALHYYGLAAQQGFRFAQHRLAECYRDGILVDRKNIMEAARLFTLSAEGQGCPDSCYQLGHLYDTGAVGFRRDLTLAEKWYSNAAAAAEHMGLTHITQKALDALKRLKK